MPAPTAEQLTAFDNAAGSLKAAADGVDTDQAALDKANSALAAVTADRDAKAGTVADGMTAMQTSFNSLVTAGLAIGLVLPAAVPPA